MTEPWRDAVATVAQTPRLLVALDFDGVLAPLVDDAASSRMLPRSRDAIAMLAANDTTAVAFVSGRSLDDLRAVSEYRDDSGIWLAGSHGAELQVPAAWRSPEQPDPMAAVARPHDSAAVIEAAESLVADLDGVRIERKAFGFAVHTRLADDDATVTAHHRVDDLVARLAPQWRRRSGHDVIEFAWRHEGKDAAVARLRELASATAVLFAGDDVTDEDALRSLLPGDLGVKVGHGETAATVRVADPAEFADLLSELAKHRAS